MMRIVIRADAGTKVGVGHVARCMALADALREAGAEPVFAMRQGSAEAVAGFGKEGVVESTFQSMATMSRRSWS